MSHDSGQLRRQHLQIGMRSGTAARHTDMSLWVAVNVCVQEEIKKVREGAGNE